MADFPRMDLIFKPTPLHRLVNASYDLGLDLWIKRDDCTGFALGGNKGRKLEYLMPKILASGAEVVVTSGQRQSNFIRQLAAACAMHGIVVKAVVMQLPHYAAAAVPATGGLLQAGGNQVLDRILDVEFVERPDGDWEALQEQADQLADELEAQGIKVYRVAVGGSSPLSAFAFYEAGREAAEQSGEFDWIIVPSSSGSTHAGLHYYYQNLRTRILGISADPDPEFEFAADIADLCNELAKLLGESCTFQPSDILLNLEFTGEAYSIPSQEGNAAIKYLARREGIFLDPVYSGKAFAGLTSLAMRGEVSGRVLFWHTGGSPLLFAAQDFA